MTGSLILAAVWAVAVNLVALVPARRPHRPQLWALIAAGIPILGAVTVQHGPWVAMLVAAAGVAVLRWPLAPALRRLARRLGARERP